MRAERGVRDSRRQWYLLSGTRVFSLGYQASPTRGWEGVLALGFAEGQVVSAGHGLGRAKPGGRDEGGFVRTQLWENHAQVRCSRAHRRRRALPLVLRDSTELASSTRISGRCSVWWPSSVPRSRSDMVTLLPCSGAGPVLCDSTVLPACKSRRSGHQVYGSD